MQVVGRGSRITQPFYLFHNIFVLYLAQHYVVPKVIILDPANCSAFTSVKELNVDFCYSKTETGNL